MKNALTAFAAIALAAGLLLSCALPAAATGEAGDRAVAPIPVQITVTTDKPVYRPGELVTMTLTAKNVSTQPVKLTFTSGQRYDFIVSFQNQVLWKWSDGKAFPAVMGYITLLPGQSVSYRVAEYRAQQPWPTFAPAEFTLDLTGILTSVPPYSGKTQFKISPYTS